MANVSISKETKASILSEIQDGRSFAQLYFPFLGSDPDFAKELVDLAVKVDNQTFLRDLEKFIDSQHSGSDAKKPKKGPKNKKPRNSHSTAYKRYSKSGKLKKKYKVRPNKKFKLSENYAPTGKTVDDYLKEKGISLNPNYKRPWVQFVSGGLPGLGKRK